MWVKGYTKNTSIICRDAYENKSLFINKSLFLNKFLFINKIYIIFLFINKDLFSYKRD